MIYNFLVLNYTFYKIIGYFCFLKFIFFTVYCFQYSTWFFTKTRDNRNHVAANVWQQETSGLNGMTTGTTWWQLWQKEPRGEIWQQEPRAKIWQQEPRSGNNGNRNHVVKTMTTGTTWWEQCNNRNHVVWTVTVNHISVLSQQGAASVPC